MCRTGAARSPPAWRRYLPWRRATAPPAAAAAPPRAAAAGRAAARRRRARAVRRRQAARGAGHAARVDARGRARRGGGRARGPARTARRPGRRARGRPPRRYQICSPKTPLSRPSWGPRTAATSPQRRTRAERIRTRAGARRRESPTRTARLRPDFGDLGGADRDGDRAARRQKKVPNQVFIGNEGASGRARTQDERPVRFVAAGDVLRDRGGPRKAEKGAPRAIPGQKI